MLKAMCFGDLTYMFELIWLVIFKTLILSIGEWPELPVFLCQPWYMGLLAIAGATVRYQPRLACEYVAGCGNLRGLVDLLTANC